MTKSELIARVNELEAAQAPRSPAPVVAHQAGAATRQAAIVAGRKTRQGAIVAGSCVSGFFAGLFGK